MRSIIKKESNKGWLHLNSLLRKLYAFPYAEDTLRRKYSQYQVYVRGL
jgi:hypothetical protein